MKRREIRDMGGTARSGRINLSAEELKVVEKVVKSAGLKWFSYVERNYGDRRDKNAEHFYPFDRVLDRRTRRLMSVSEALKRIEDEISLKTLECLDEHEREVYAGLYERSFVVSKYIRPKYRGIFRNKGLWRRIVRWSAMDELVESLVSEEARKLWDAEGYPRGVLNVGLVNIPNMKWFRESIEKTELTEEEFDRISEVFRKCINI